MTVVIASAVFWGMFAYSFAVLGAVLGLSIKLALLLRDRGVLRRELDDAERRVKDATAAAEGAKEETERYKREIGVLRDELEKADNDLGPDGVADRLKRLLSGKVPKDDPEDDQGRDSVSVASGANGKPG